VRLFVDPSFPQLLCNPKRIGVSRHIETQDFTPVVADNEKTVQNTEGECWDGEKVHRRNTLQAGDEAQGGRICLHH
jgi:hypothetical protein